MEQQLKDALEQLKFAETEEVCQTAVNVIERLATENFAEAQTQLGLLYCHGTFVKKDVKIANQWFLRAAQQGHGRAQNAIANSFYDGEGMEKNEHIALEWYKKSAAQNCVRGLLSLGSCYYYGKCGLKKDESKAKELLDKAKILAKENNDEFLISYCFSYSQIGEQDIQQAIEWCILAANKGHSDAQYHLGWYYDCGHVVGVTKEEGKKIAYEWYRKSAKNGNELAIINLSNHLFRQDMPEEAIYWLKRGALKGSSACKYTLGRCYDPGDFFDLSKVVSKNIDVSTKWYLDAANREHTEAYFALGELFYLGRNGARKNYRLAVDYLHKYVQFIKTSKRTHYWAECYLGDCYFEGTGVEKNEDTAFMWMTTAAENGNMRAQETLGNWFHSKKEYKKAVDWWKKAAKQGSQIANVSLSEVYWSGQGVKIDKEKSFDLMIQAAESGYVTAMANLGMMYSATTMFGIGKNPDGFSDIRESIKWFRRAAAAGFVEVHSRLAVEIDTLVEYAADLKTEERTKFIEESLEWVDKAIGTDREGLKFHTDTAILSQFRTLLPIPKYIFGSNQVDSPRLTSHFNIVPFDRIICHGFTLNNFMHSGRKFTLREIVHVGIQLCDALIHCQKSNCSVLCCIPASIYIILPRVYEIRQLYLKEIEYLPSHLLSIVGEYLEGRILHTTNVTTDIFLHSRLFLSGFNYCASFQGKRADFPWSLNAEEPPFFPSREEIAPEVRGKKYRMCGFANAYGLGHILRTMRNWAHEDVKTDLTLNYLISSLLEEKTERRMPLEIAKKLLLSC